MWNNHTSQFYGSAPSFLSESFGKFNELMILYYLMNQEKEGINRRFYYQQLVKTLLNIFYASPEAIIEYNLYKGITSGKVKNADDLDAITYATGLQLDSRYNNTKSLKNTWIERGIYYEAPLLKSVEPYASLLAVKYFELFLKKRDRFVGNYIRFLEEGLPGEPNILLKKHLGIDIDSPQFFASCMDFLDEQVRVYKHEVMLKKKE